MPLLRLKRIYLRIIITPNEVLCQHILALLSFSDHIKAPRAYSYGVIFPKENDGGTVKESIYYLMFLYIGPYAAHAL